MPDAPRSRASPEPQDGRSAPIILLVEDHVEMRDFLREVLSHDGYEVHTASSGLEAMAQLDAEYASPCQFFRAPVDLIITDYRMPGATGLELLAHAQQYTPPPLVILVSAFADSHLHSEARQLGAAAILAKPFSVRQLLVTVDRLLRREGAPPL